MRAKNFSAVVAASNFGWLSGAPLFFGDGSVGRFRLAVAAGFGGWGVYWGIANFDRGETETRCQDAWRRPHDWASRPRPHPCYTQTHLLCAVMPLSSVCWWRTFSERSGWHLDGMLHTTANLQLTTYSNVLPYRHNAVCRWYLDIAYEANRQSYLAAMKHLHCNVMTAPNTDRWWTQ